MVILKTYFYTYFEFDYLLMNLLESYDYVDKFLIMEYNRTHTGDEREFIWDKYKHIFPEDKMDKIHYLPLDISDVVKKTNNESIIHNINERYMRGYFTKFIDLNDDDIIISVDADEIIYRDSYPKIIRKTMNDDMVTLKMHQFFYKFNYLWVDNEWVAPQSSKYKVHKNDFPNNWRYGGKKMNEIIGCHFSWCMSVDDMIYKLKTYSHSPSYKQFAKKDILEKAVENKEYPFDRNKNFNIKTLSEKEMIKIMPKSYFEIKK